MAGAAGIDSDDFSSGSLESFWTGLNGAPTFEGTGTANAWIVLSTTTSDYHYWNDGPTTVRGNAVVQPCTDNTDFTIEVKIETLPGNDGEECAIFCHEIGTTSATIGTSFGYYYDEGLFLYRANSPGGADFIFSSERTGDSAPMWLRLEYTASSGVWEFHVSDDGSDWATGANVVSNLTESNTGWSDPHVGIIVNNTGSNQVAHSQKFDYFWEVTDPISPEDPTGGRRVMVIS
jgi:hypothetical protein